MKHSIRIAFAAFVVAAQLPALASEIAVLKNGFSIRCERREQNGDTMRLNTAAQLGVADPFDPKANVDAGTLYLSRLLDQYHDDPIKALAAYNAGAHRVDKYHGIPPFYETHAYIARIVRDFNARKRAQMKAVAPATTAFTSAAKRGKKTKTAQASADVPSATN